MAMKGDMSKMCMGGMCGRCHGGKALVGGLLLLAARWAYPAWDPWMVVGGLLALGGLLKWAWPMCPHCK